MKRSTVFALAVIACVVGGAATARSSGFVGIDRQIAAAVSDPHRSVGAVDATALEQAVGDTGAGSRRLILRALKVLERVRLDPRAISPDEADILASVLAAVRSSRANEEQQAIDNALGAVQEAVWTVYVAPLAKEAAGRELTALGSAPDARIVRRWFDLSKGRGVTVAELFAAPARRELSWSFTDLVKRTPVAAAVARRAVDDAGKAGIAPPRLVLHLEVSGLGRDAQTAAGAPRTSGRLFVRIEDSDAVVTACLAAIPSPSVVEVPAPADKTRPKSAETSAAAVKSSERTSAEKPTAVTEAECHRRFAPSIGVRARAVLVDPNRQLEVFDRPLGDRRDVEAALDLAESLGKEWP